MKFSSVPLFWAEPENATGRNEITNPFCILATLCKVRGYKTIIKFFPHEVSDMEHVTELLHFQSSAVWQIPYILVLWLSIIVLVPFDLTTIDSGE